MTHLELQISSGAYKVSRIIDSIGDRLKAAFNKIREGQQRKANIIVANHLRHEYPHESFGYILRLVEEGRVNELYK